MDFTKQALVIFLIITPIVSNAINDPEMIDLEFKVFSVDRIAIEGLSYRPKADSEAFSRVFFNPRQRSTDHPYRGPRELVFYETVPTTGSGSAPIPVALASLPKGIQNPLLFFVRIPNLGDGKNVKYKVLVTEDSTSRFPYGHLRVLNASGAYLNGRIGGESVTLGFEASRPWQTDCLFRRGESWVNVAFFLDIENNNELVYANQLRFEPESRSVLVVRPPRRQSSARVMTFILEDFEPPKEVTEAE